MLNSEFTPNSSPNAAVGKRQRLFNMMKTTKDVYLPTLTSSLSNLKAEASSTLKNYYYVDDSGTRGANGGLQPLQDIKLLTYPSYTRMTPDGSYVTFVRGLVYTPGTMNRKNRLILSLCKQFFRPNGDPVEAEEKLENVLNNSSYNESTTTLDSDASSISTGSTTVAVPDVNHEDTLKSRISGFFSKNIADAPLVVDIVGAGEHETTFASTDSLGNFQLKITTDFEPQQTTITVDTPSNVTTSYHNDFVKDSGFGLISDIDDTVKHTGVVGDKRSVFCNIFVNDFSTWLIPGMSLWYNTLKHTSQVDFFYVSNSPCQIYPVLHDYISHEYPMGPMFLKQYSGNLLSSLMTSSAKRKLSSIVTVCRDFPHKKFILVGDSGEQDLEAYIATARQFPDQIIGIYIRCCKNSMSDVPSNDWNIMDELNSLIEGKYYEDKATAEKLDVSKSHQTQEVQEVPDLITFDDEPVTQTHSETPHVPPPVPTRKPVLSKDQEHEILQSKKQSPPPLPRKPTRLSMRGLDSSQQQQQPPPPPVPAAKVDDSVYYTPSSQNDYGTYGTFFDKRADSWRQRVLSSIVELKNCHTSDKVRFMFFKEPELCLEDSIGKIRELSSR